MRNNDLLIKALDYIPSDDDETWYKVGMACKHEGIPYYVFDAWSMRSPNYDDKQNRIRWDSFSDDKDSIVTGGTILNYAINNGFTYKSVSKSKAKLKNIKADDKDVDQLIKYLDVLHNDNDYVSIVTHAIKKEKIDQETGEVTTKYIPANKGELFNVGELKKKLNSSQSVEDAVGFYNHDAGVWIRVNATQGSKDNDIMSYKYVLVESDTMGLDEQFDLMVNVLEMPIAALVTSGNKSLHAIVKVDAQNADEYKERVKHVFDVCEQYGLSIDQANKNPSRLSRMPGVSRGSGKQELIATQIGQRNYIEWVEFVKAIGSDLPPLTHLSSIYNYPAPKETPIIYDHLNKGTKMIMSGASKIGKSFMSIELALALATGHKWLDMDCHMSKTLYLNMEIRENAFNERLKNVSDAMGIDLKTIPDDNLMIWNLRSKGMPLKDLAPMIIERCKDYDFDVVIIDPIYKVMYANENDAEEVSEFSSELDHLCEAMDASVIYVHHHSKGAQSSKAANDRMSGSGVFARDPDAIDDIIELELTDDVREKLSAKYKRMIMENFLEKNSEQFRQRPKHLETTQSDIDTAIKYQLDEKQKHELKVLIRRAEENLESATAGQMTCSLREFRSPKPKNMFFVYPIHIFDSEGWLDNAKAKDKAMSDQVKKKKTNMSKFRKTYEEMQDEFKGGLVPIALIAEKIGVSEKTIKRYIDEMPDEFMRLKGSVKKI